MTSLLQEIRAALTLSGLAPNKKLGQHFMIDAGVLQTLVDAILAGAPDTARVVEVGPGTGVLTSRLLAAGASVLAIELDHGLAALQRQRFAEHPRFELIEGDCLDGKNALHPGIAEWIGQGPWVLGSNLPYDVSLPVILNALAMQPQPERVAVTVQLEAAQRLCAQPGTKAWGATAAVAQAAGTGRILRRVPPAAFHPRPRVASALLGWTCERALPAGFGRWCRSLFAYRRKRVTRALRHLAIDTAVARQLADACGLDIDLRVEQMSVAQLLDLHERQRNVVPAAERGDDACL